MGKQDRKEGEGGQGPTAGSPSPSTGSSGGSGPAELSLLHARKLGLHTPAPVSRGEGIWGRLAGSEGGTMAPYALLALKTRGERRPRSLRIVHRKTTAGARGRKLT